jgi:hypothetical protein
MRAASFLSPNFNSLRWIISKTLVNQIKECKESSWVEALPIQKEIPLETKKHPFEVLFKMSLVLLKILTANCHFGGIENRLLSS